MAQPVKVAQSGITYEEDNLTSWLASHPYTDPKTNVRFDERLTRMRDEKQQALAEADARILRERSEMRRQQEVT